MAKKQDEAAEVEAPVTPDQVSGPVTEDPTPDSPLTPEQEQAARQKAYSEASTWLRTTYRGEFNGKVKELCDAAGVSWTPRPTKQERAREKALAMLAEAGIDPQSLIDS